MRNYVLALVSVSIISGILEILSPSGICDGIKKHIRLICALCVLCVLIYPVTELLGELSVMDNFSFDEIYSDTEGDYEGVFEENLLFYSASSIASGLRELLCGNFSLSQDEVDVFVFLSDDCGEDRIERTVIYLSGTAILQDPRDIEEYVISLINTSVEIVYE